jgi:uncharacterized delta-60 repeat protein
VWVWPDGRILLLVEQDPCGDRIPTLVRLLPDGTLDTSLDDDGVLVFATSGGAIDLQPQPDGKFLVAGSREIRRFLPDFRLDEAGQTVTNFGAFEDDVAYDALLQPDGKLLVAGEGAAQPGARDVAVARYNADGSLDATFRYGGKAYFATNADERGRALALQPDGKIVVAGNLRLTNEDHLAVFRLNPDGTHDTSFNVVGYRWVDFGSGSSVAQAVTILPDGKILLGGQAANGTSAGDNDFVLVRLQPDGRTDFSFGDSGLVKTTIGSGHVEVQDMLRLPDGRILLAGGRNGATAERGQFVLAAYLPDGDLDLSFGPDGTGIVEMGFVDGSGNPYYDIAQAMLLLPNGQIVVSGYSGGDWATLVLNADGTPADFGVTWPLRIGWGIETSPHDLALQDDGKLLVVGAGVDEGETDSQFLVARYQLAPDNVGLDTSFGDAGQIRTTVQVRSGAFAVVPGADGITVAGYSDNGENLDFALARYTAGDAGLPPSGAATFLPVIVK